MASSSRRSGWIIACALVACGLTTIAVVLWFWLPRWAPDWVVRNSPWFDPAYRAGTYTGGENRRQLIRRISSKGWAARALAAVTAEQADPSVPYRKSAIDFIRLWSLSSSAREPMTALIWFMQRDPDLDVRLKAIRAIPDYRINEALNQVIGMAADPEVVIRREVAWALGMMHELAATTALITMLRDPDTDVAVIACLSLGITYDPQAITPLLQLLDQPRQPVVRAAWGALWDLPDDGGKSSRLARLPVADVLDWMLVELAGDSNQRDWLLAFDQQALAWGVNGFAGLIPVLTSEDSNLREFACRALAVVLANEVTPFQADRPALWNADAYDTRVERVDAAMRQGQDVIAALLKASGDADADVQRFAFIGLRGSDTAEVRAAAVGALDDHAAVALEAALTLAVIQDTRAYAPLMRMLDENPDNEERPWVIMGLGRLGEQRAIDRLLAVLRDEANKDAGAAAAEALGELGDLRAVPPLLAVVESGRHSAPLVNSAIFSLAQLGDWRATPALIVYLNHDKADDDTQRQNVVMCLGELGDPRAIPALITSLRRDPAQDVRREAVMALSCFRDPRAVDALLTQLDSTDPREVRFAAVALLRIGDPRVADRLIGLLDGPHEVGFLTTLVDGLSRMPLSAEQRARMCSPTREPVATPGSGEP